MTAVKVSVTLPVSYVEDSLGRTASFFLFSRPTTLVLHMPRFNCEIYEIQRN